MSFLASRLSAMTSATADAILNQFVDYASEQKLELYPAQEEAILELLQDKHVVLATPTGSGKSLVALAFHFQAMAQNKRSFYTCPIKALVNEKFFALCEAFGADQVGMLTGDAAINAKAPIICCTAEILANLAIRDQRIFAECVVMDEFHYYGDKERGVAWQVPLLTMPETQFLLMSATLGDVSQITESIRSLTKKEVAEVRSTQRPVPLDFVYAESPLHDTIKAALNQQRAPLYLVNFTQRAAAEQAQALMSIDVSSKEDKEQLKLELKDTRFDTPFGKELRRLLLHGVGLHHAGLLPKYRRLVERLAQSGLLKVISGTDTLGVGVNIPIRTVLFTQLCKFDGEKTGILAVRDFQQIAGRAGRRGFDTQGYVVAQAPAHVIDNIQLQAKRAAGKKVTLQKPPERGFVHWDVATFQKLQTSSPERLEPRFTVNHSLLVNVLQAHHDAAHGGYRELVKLILSSHLHAGGKVRLLKHARTLTRSLVSAQVVNVRRKSESTAATLTVAEGLQPDFSLNHSLSLFLLEALPSLPQEAPDWHLNVLSLVESILESPDVVLFAQLDALKTAKIQELKAQGVEFAQRQEELEKLEWPKPNRDFIYGTFDAFAAKHPWVGVENIRPKSIARDLFERCMSFNEYIKEYGLQRSEGVLLRYLSQAYKTINQNVPDSVRTEALEDLSAFLLTALKATDSSLLDEWQSMQGEPKTRAVAAPAEPKVKRVDLATDLKQLKARVRAEMHRIAFLLARMRFDDAAEALGPAFSEKALTQQFIDAPQFEFSPKARRPEFTQVTPAGPRQFKVRHSMLDAKGESDWYLEGVVDLTERTDSEGLLVEVLHVGT